MKKLFPTWSYMKPDEGKDSWQNGENVNESCLCILLSYMYYCVTAAIFNSEEIDPKLNDEFTIDVI